MVSQWLTMRVPTVVFFLAPRALSWELHWETYQEQFVLMASKRQVQISPSLYIQTHTHTHTVYIHACMICAHLTIAFDGGKWNGDYAISQLDFSLGFRIVLNSLQISPGKIGHELHTCAWIFFKLLSIVSVFWVYTSLWRCGCARTIGFSSRLPNLLWPKTSPQTVIDISTSTSWGYDFMVCCCAGRSGAMKTLSEGKP